MLIEFAIYLTTGAVVGFLAGLLGIGGGLVIVPILSTVFVLYLGVPDVVHLAIGTSLATILVTSFSSVKAHHRIGNVRWDIVRTLSLGIFIGAFLGGWSSQFFANNTLAIIFGTIEILIALLLLSNYQPNPHREMPSIAPQTVAGGVIGSLASLVGIGGGTLSTPYLLWHNVTMHQAIATSAACSLPVAAAGTFGYLLGGMNATNLPDYATGYVYWPAFIGIVLTSYFTAPLGARVSAHLPVKLLKKLFAVLLFILAFKMFFF